MSGPHFSHYPLPHTFCFFFAAEPALYFVISSLQFLSSLPSIFVPHPTPPDFPYSCHQWPLIFLTLMIEFQCLGSLGTLDYFLFFDTHSTLGFENTPVSWFSSCFTVHVVSVTIAYCPLLLNFFVLEGPGSVPGTLCPGELRYSPSLSSDAASYTVLSHML